MRVTMQISNEADLRAELLRRSKVEGGAWVAHVEPFGGATILQSYTSPARVPDEYMASTPGLERGIAYKGRVVPYTPAATVREGNRGMGNQ